MPRALVQRFSFQGSKPRSDPRRAFGAIWREPLPLHMAEIIRATNPWFRASPAELLNMNQTPHPFDQFEKSGRSVPNARRKGKPWQIYPGPPTKAIMLSSPVISGTRFTFGKIPPDEFHLQYENLELICVSSGSRSARQAPGTCALPQVFGPNIQRHILQ
jgi:hypothetical protein